ncbi:MAG: ACT domain-containing protein [Coriobacteriia bacterium]|nr:ACT domain-containing protein [Coriobacteriia bacterium]
MIDQLTVFLENKKGRLAALCRALGDAGISMRALTIAEAERYGVVRIIADDPPRALAVLQDLGFQASLTQVFAVEVPDVPGGLAALLEAFEAHDVNVEYAYCFSTADGKAIDVLRLSDPEAAAKAIEKIGYRVIEPPELGA